MACMCPSLQRPTLIRIGPNLLNFSRRFSSHTESNSQPQGQTASAGINQRFRGPDSEIIKPEFYLWVWTVSRWTRVSRWRFCSLYFQGLIAFPCFFWGKAYRSTSFLWMQAFKPVIRSQTVHKPHRPFSVKKAQWREGWRKKVWVIQLITTETIRTSVKQRGKIIY